MKKKKVDLTNIRYGDGTEVPEEIGKTFVTKDGMFKVDKTYKQTPFFKEWVKELERAKNPLMRMKVFECHHQLDYEMYKNDVLQVEHPYGYIRLGCRGKNNIDISRIQVDDGKMDKGFGGMLMDLILMSFFFTIQSNFDKIQSKKMNVPMVSLECTGSVGLGKTKRDTPLEKQIHFFSKYCFDVVGMEHLGYVEMKLNFGKFGQYTENKIKQMENSREQ